MEIRATTDWQSFFDLATDFTAGEQSLLIQNKGNDVLVLKFQSISPDANDKDGLHIYLRESFVLPRNVENLYIRGYNDVCQVEVVDTDNYQSGAFLPADIFTSDTYGVRRLSVDSQQTSFEANQQFGYSSSIDDVAYASAIVYKFITTTPVNIFERRFSLSSGGRHYQVYSADDFSVEPTGTFAEAGRIAPMNNILHGGLTVHPDTNVTITRAIAPTYTLNTSYPITQERKFIGSTGSQLDTPASYTPDGIRRGLSAGTYYILMTDYGGTNDNTDAVLELVWEERT